MCVTEGEREKERKERWLNMLMDYLGVDLRHNGLLPGQNSVVICGSGHRA